MQQLKTIEYDSREYDSMCRLRDDILRKPIGLRLTKEEKQRDAGDTLIACMEDENVIACCILTYVNETTGRLRQMAVREEYQKKGIGKQVLDYAELLAQKKGCDCLTMHARQVAVAFYIKSGYEICSEEFLEVGISHVEMTKKL